MPDEKNQTQQKKQYRRRRRPPKSQQQKEGQPSPDQQSNQTNRDIATSVIVPLYNEEGSLQELSGQLKDVLGRMGMPYEIIFVDDGSTDGSFKVLRELHRNNKRVKVIRLRKNFGKSAALALGFQQAKGEIVITLDADLQDDPAEIPNLVRELKKGYDVISGWKKRRRDPITKTVPSKLFNYTVRLITGIKIHDFNCGLKAYRKDVVKTIRVYGELHRFIPVLAHWQGFKIGELIVLHRKRKYGRTKFGITRYLKGFLDFITVLFTTRFAARPLHLFGTIGIISFLTGFCIDAYLTIQWLLGNITLSNRPLLLAGFLLIIVGVQFFAIGLLGEMISRERNMEDEYSIREILE
jgi:glycosyltransferase involved in cell wall biosynthesis